MRIRYYTWGGADKRYIVVNWGDKFFDIDIKPDTPNPDSMCIVLRDRFADRFADRNYQRVVGRPKLIDTAGNIVVGQESWIYYDLNEFKLFMRKYAWVLTSPIGWEDRELKIPHKLKPMRRP